MRDIRIAPEAHFNPHPKPLLLTLDLRDWIRAICDEVEAENAVRFARLHQDNNSPVRARSALEHIKAQWLREPHDAASLVDDLCTISANQHNELFKEALQQIYLRSPLQHRLSASHFPELRRSARKILFHLWAKELVLLPITVPLWSGTDKLSGLAVPDLYRFCAEFPDQGSSANDVFRLRRHAVQWLPMTAWTRPERISMQAALDVNRFLAECRKGSVGFAAPAVATCVRLLLAKLLEWIPDRVSFDSGDLAQFDIYFARRFGSDITFEQISAVAQERDAKQKAALNAKWEKSSKYRLEKEHKSRKNERQQSLDRLAEKIAAEAGENEADPTDELIYNTQYRREVWFLDLSELSFLSVRLSSEAQEVWSRLFDRYIEFRAERCFEDEREPRLALRCLADYIALAPPAKCSYSELRIRPPLKPADFLRSDFIDPNDKILRSSSFPAYLNRRYSSIDTVYSKLRQVWQFFEFVVLTYGDEASAHIAGPKFVNPISKDFDLPRVRGVRSRGTNKLPFGRAVVPHLLLWLYAVEEFGRYVVASGIELPAKRPTGDTEDFGYVPFYSYMGKTFPVRRIPLGILLPQVGRQGASMTVIRLIMVTLETGLRFQNVQWLCRMTFDKPNQGKLIRDVAQLYVNTDKAGPAFVTPVLQRVREVLLREQADQEACGVEDREIPYEGREHSRFDRLVPLFRNIKSHQPVDDNVYDGAWTWILACFQVHLKPISPVLFVRPRPIKAKPQVRNREGWEYCPVSYQRLYTPHSARSTFITRRSPFISIGDLADLVGHANAWVTSHYDYPELDELQLKLQYAERAMQDGTPEPAPVQNGPPFVKATGQNAALVKAFTKDREATIASFGMIAIRPALEADDEQAAGLELLRASPMSQVVFRETHICPVGEICPAEVVAAMRGERRCGACPLACKCVDHLPAIAAKQRLLVERIQSRSPTHYVATRCGWRRA